MFNLLNSGEVPSKECANDIARIPFLKFCIMGFRCVPFVFPQISIQ